MLLMQLYYLLSNILLFIVLIYYYLFVVLIYLFMLNIIELIIGLMLIIDSFPFCYSIYCDGLILYCGYF